MDYLKYYVISSCSSPVQDLTAMGMMLNTTPLSEMCLHLWRDVFSHVSQTLSVWLLVPYVRSILNVYVSVYHTFYLSLFR